MSSHLKRRIRSLEQKHNSRRVDLRRAYNDMLSQPPLVGGGQCEHCRHCYWAMVAGNHINKRFATEVESAMDGMELKTYPTTVAAMREMWDADTNFQDHFGGEFIEPSLDDVVRRAREEAAAKAGTGEGADAAASGSKGDTLKERIERRRRGPN